MSMSIKRANNCGAIYHLVNKNRKNWSIPFYLQFIFKTNRQANKIKYNVKCKSTCRKHVQRDVAKHVILSIKFLNFGSEPVRLAELVAPLPGSNR